MSQFVSRVPVRIEADDDSGEWVEIKAKLSRGDRRRLNKAVFSYDLDGEVEIHTTDWATEILRVAIVGWHLQDPDNPEQWMSFDIGVVDDFDPDSPLIVKVLRQVTEQNPTLWMSGDAKSGSTNSESSTNSSPDEVEES